jgi:spore coat polysaccharide biosynthesis protein SpsF
LNSKKDKLKIAAIVQARLGSTRLPGKILKDLSGRPMLWHVINRLSGSRYINQTVIATTILSEDDPVQSFCEENNFSFYRGSPENVLSRYYEAAVKYEADIIIRITSDCPVIDPAVVDKIAYKFLTDTPDYISNCIIRTFPRGLDTEIFSFKALEKAYLEAKLQHELEHVTPYIYRHPEIFSIKNFTNDKDLSFHRWTVDTREDFHLIRKIYEELYHKKELFLLDDILNLFDIQPDLVRINQNVEQKKLEDI